MTDQKKSAAHRRVLFVDDEPQFLETVKELMGVFSEGQWEISTADSASNAFRLLQDHPVDLAVIDVQMGVMDGIQMLSLLNRGYPNVQKVVLTGHANEKYRTACLSNGAELYLEKPTAPKGWQSLYGVLSELVKFKPEEGFRGVLRRVGLQDVIQMECLARNSSVLEISNAGTTGQIFLETGSIIHAQAGDVTGEDAFNRLLAMRGGHFNLKPFTEPARRTISGQWEFLLMEAARKTDEDREAEAGTPAPTAEAASAKATADNETLLAQLESFTAIKPKPKQEVAATDTTAAPPAKHQPAPAALEADVPSRPRVDEMLVCSAEGEVFHNWQCSNPDNWILFFEFLSQRALRLAQSLPLGEFDRLEIQSNGTRAVVMISSERGVLVKSHREPLNSGEPETKPQ